MGVDTRPQNAMYASKQELIDVSLYFDVQNLLIKEEKFDAVVLWLRKDDPKDISDYWDCMTKYVSDSGSLMIIGDNCYHYRNWFDNYRAGKEPEYPRNGFSSINHVDAFLNAHGYIVRRWATVYGLPTSEDVKQEVKQAAEKNGITWEQASSKAYATTAVKMS